MERDLQSLGEREHGLLAALKNGRIWLLILIFFCIIAANSSLTFYGPTLVKEVGFTSPVAVGWIMAAAYLCGAAGMIWNGYHSDLHQEVALPLRAGCRAGRRIAAGHRDLPEPERRHRAAGADAGDRRDDERHPGILADAEPLPRRHGSRGRRGADQLDRQPRRLRRAVDARADQDRDRQSRRRACTSSRPSNSARRS